MRDIREDLQERARALELQIGGMKAFFEQQVQQLKKERENKLTALKSELETVNTVLRSERQRAGQPPVLSEDSVRAMLTGADGGR
jgi:hypothetical protein